MGMEDFEEGSGANSELRFLTLELMKIASREGRGFDDVLNDYFENAYKLKRRLLHEDWGEAPAPRRASSRR